MIVPLVVIVLLVMGIGWLFFSHRLIKLLKETTGKLAQSSDQTASEANKTGKKVTSYGKRADVTSNTVHIVDEITQRKD